jgi:hypothetical protein
MLKFFEKDHEYIKEGEKYLSVTSLLKTLDPTDWVEVKRKYAEKNGLTIDQVTEKWNKQAEGGSKLHLLEEMSLYTKDNVFQHTVVDGAKEAFNLEELKPGIYPELILYSDRYKVAGQSDLVTIFPDRTFKISDFKTDKELRFKSFPVFDPAIKRKVPQYFKEPAAGIELCNFNKYALQLSTYSLMLEQFNFKLSSDPDALQITHINTERDLEGNHILDENGNPIIISKQLYNLEYKKELVKQILNYYKNGKH